MPEVLETVYDYNQFWIVILCFLSVALCFVSFFRANIFISFACIMANVGLILIPSETQKPEAIFYMAWLLILAEVFKIVVTVLQGRKKAKKRFTG